MLATYMRRVRNNNLKIIGLPAPLVARINTIRSDDIIFLLFFFFANENYFAVNALYFLAGFGVCRCLGVFISKAERRAVRTSQSFCFFFLLIFVLHSSKIQTQIFSIHSSIVYYFFFYCNFSILNIHHTGFKIIKSTRWNIPKKEIMLLSILVEFMKLTLTIFVGFQSFRSRMHRIRLKFLSEVSYKVTVTCVSNTLYNYGLFWGEKALEGIANLYEACGTKTFCL